VRILNGEELDCLVIELVVFKCVVNQHCLTTSFLKLVLRPYFPLVMVQSSCEIFAKALVDELQGRFLNHELISALGVIYPNVWVPNLDNVSDDFH
jgi:hypothetical protein